MLFWREMKKIMCSVTYLLFAAAIAIGLYSQGVFRFGQEKLKAPQPGENYGVKYEEIPELVMPAAFAHLWEEFCDNTYRTYPFGFIKYVKLNEGEQRQMAEIISQIAKMDENEILQRGKEHAFDGETEGADVFPAIRSDMDYGRFRELMQQADDLLGGGSYYEADGLGQYGPVPLTYEEAQERYGLAVNSDKITGGYARLFSDYAVAMVMSLLPVFLAVVLSMKDRRAEMEALIYTRQCPARKIVSVRYLALLTAAMLPVLVFAYLSNIPVWGNYSGMELDYLAPLKYTLGWIMPSAMVSLAVGMFLTELTGTPLAVAVQGFWWLFDVNAGIQSTESSYALWRLAPRHNVGASGWFRTQEFLDHFRNLAANRLLFAGLSILLVALSVLAYEAKRKGRLGEIRFRNRRN